MDNIITAVVIILIVALCVYRSKKMKKDGIIDPKAKRKYRWATFGWAVALMFVLAGITNVIDPNYDKDSDNSSSAKTTKFHHVAKTSKQQASKEKTNAEKKKNKTVKVSKNDEIAAALMILRNNYKGKAEVWYSHENQFMIWPNKASFKKALMYVINSNDTKDWRTLTDSIDRLSRSIYKGKYGIKSPVCLANPGNNNRILYASLNGKSTYDFMEN